MLVGGRCSRRDCVRSSPARPPPGSLRGAAKKKKDLIRCMFQASLSSLWTAWKLTAQHAVPRQQPAQAAPLGFSSLPTPVPCPARRGRPWSAGRARDQARQRLDAPFPGAGRQARGALAHRRVRPEASGSGCGDSQARLWAWFRQRRWGRRQRPAACSVAARTPPAEAQVAPPSEAAAVAAVAAAVAAYVGAAAAEQGCRQHSPAPSLATRPMSQRRRLRREAAWRQRRRSLQRPARHSLQTPASAGPEQLSRPKPAACFQAHRRNFFAMAESAAAAAGESPLPAAILRGWCWNPRPPQPQPAAGAGQNR